MEINPLAIALNGIVHNYDAICIASQGFIFEISEEIIEIPVVNRGGGVVLNRNRNKNKDYKLLKSLQKFKRITVKCEKDGVVITQSKNFKNLKVSISDIDIKIVEKASKPQIKINLKIE